MTVKGTRYFAAACIISFTTAEKLDLLSENHTINYDHDVLALARLISDNMKEHKSKSTQDNAAFGSYDNSEIDPEHIPNWMRAFYDDFSPESQGREE